MPTFQLVMRRGPRAGEKYQLKTQTVIVGRDTSTDISINDPEVSRNHCRLILDRSYFIQDLGSTNGTFVDGKRLGGEPQRLLSGQIVQLGSNVTLLYQELDGDDAVMSTAVTVGEPIQPTLSETSEPEIIDPYNEVESAGAADFSGLEDILEQDDLPEEGDGDLPAYPDRPRQAQSAGYGAQPYEPYSHEGEEEENRRTYIIIAIVAGGLLLCCCCLVIVGIAAYLQSEGQLDTLLGLIPPGFGFSGEG